MLATKNLTAEKSQQIVGIDPANRMHGDFKLISHNHYLSEPVNLFVQMLL